MAKAHMGSAFVHIVNDGPDDVVVEVVAEHGSFEKKIVRADGKSYKLVGPYRSVLISYLSSANVP